MNKQIINPLDEVQPVDGYVRGLLERAVKKHNIKVDLENPTRRQRLEAALVLQNENNGWSSMEIMVGKRIDASEPHAETYDFLMGVQRTCPQDPRRFYEGFAHNHWP
ncbi:MAG: hypothetical protein PHH54_05030 [Candidatus Nanoarchaeia archaeon]|nr:hypothetical protein [Candidatus Nanoarchaeia archaeon]MDD5741322.1 hypothetical protein [Candidatus Nanoarchaeia archaeon]